MASLHDVHLLSMDRYTRLTKAWLDNRYRRPVANGIPNFYCGHQPIYGLGAPNCEPNHARRIVRLFQLLRRVRQAGGRTLLDVGGSEGYFAQLCRELFGMTVVSVDLSEEACRRAAEIFAVPGAAVDAASLPFAADSFDVVTCAEVVEHLADPVPAILELQRVARGSLVLATEEWQVDAADRDRILDERRATPHGERSIFADVDMRPLFAPYEVAFERQEVPDLTRFGDDAHIDRAGLRQTLLDLGAGKHRAAAEMGIVLLVRKPGPRVPTPRVPTDAEIADHLLRRQQQLHVIGAPTPVIPLPEGVTLRCVGCGASFAGESGPLACACGLRFVRHRGVFDFVTDLTAFGERVDHMLAERGGPAYADQRSDLLALAAKLALPYPEPLVWQFDGNDPQARQWRANDQLVSKGSGRYQVTGSDPSLVHDAVGCSPRQASLISVEMAVKLDDPKQGHDMAELYWMVDGQLEFSPGCSASVVVVPDGKFHTCTFQAPPSLRGEIVLSLRLDPICVGRGEVRLRSLRLHGDEA